MNVFLSRDCILDLFFLDLFCLDLFRFFWNRGILLNNLHHGLHIVKVLVGGSDCHAWWWMHAWMEMHGSRAKYACMHACMHVCICMHVCDICAMFDSMIYAEPMAYCRCLRHRTLPYHPWILAALMLQTIRTSMFRRSIGLGNLHGFKPFSQQVLKLTKLFQQFQLCQLVWLLFIIKLQLLCQLVCALQFFRGGSLEHICSKCTDDPPLNVYMHAFM